MSGCSLNQTSHERTTPGAALPTDGSEVRLADRLRDAGAAAGSGTGGRQASAGARRGGDGQQHSGKAQVAGAYL